MRLRIEAIVFQAVVVEYDDEGRPVADALTHPPTKIYRTRLGTLEAELAKLDAQLVNKARIEAPVPSTT